MANTVIYNKISASFLPVRFFRDLPSFCVLPNTLLGLFLLLPQEYTIGFAFKTNINYTFPTNQYPLIFCL